MELIDNNEALMYEHIKEYLKNSKKTHISTGYFYLNGFNLVKDDFQEGSKTKILIGDETNKKTTEQIAKGYSLKIAKEELKEQIDSLNKLSDETKKQRIAELPELIKDNKIDFRVYTDKKLHSKLYLFDYKNTSIVGSSNFSYGGLKNNLELNIKNNSWRDYNKLLNWFEKIWEEGEEFNTYLINIIENSKLYKEYAKNSEDGEWNYLEPREFFIQLIKLYGFEEFLDSKQILLPFQLIDYIKAKEILAKAGGALITSSVGLGKSFVAAKIAEDFKKEQKKTLIIAAPNIKNQWKEYMSNFGLRFKRDYDFLSMYELSQKNWSPTRHKNYGLILLDEAHNFRNKNNRYDSFERLKGGNPQANYLFLTATPINNRIGDMFYLTRLLHNQRKFEESGLDLDFSILKKHKSNKWKDVPQSDKNAISRLRKNLTAQTTRLDIKKLFDGKIKIGKETYKLMNPKLNKIEFNYVDNRYKEIYNEIIPFLKKLNLVHLTIFDPYKDFEGRKGRLPALHKMVLFKRLMSCIFSFYKSLINLKTRNTELLTLLETGDLKLINSRLMENMKKINKKREEITLDDYDIDSESELDELGFKIKEKDLENYTNAIRKDLVNINEFMNKIEDLEIEKVKLRDNEYLTGSYIDPKLDKLIEYIDKNKNKKIVLFSEFKDTIDYLNAQLGNLNARLGNLNAQLGNYNKIKVTGKTRNKPAEVNKFKQNKAIKLLLSTDTLSEGVNLPEADIILNFDLPWNPVRLIQRIGRADRLNNEKEIYVANFIPHEDIDSETNLIDGLNMKLETIIEIFGSEYAILDEEETEKILQSRKTEVAKELLSEKRKAMRESNYDALEQENQFGKDNIGLFMFKGSKEYKISKTMVKNAPSFGSKFYTSLTSNEEGLSLFYRGNKVLHNTFNYSEDRIPEFSGENRHKLTKKDSKEIDNYISTKYDSLWKEQNNEQKDRLQSEKDKIVGYIMSNYLRQKESLDPNLQQEMKNEFSKFKKSHFELRSENELIRFRRKYCTKKTPRMKVFTQELKKLNSMSIEEKRKREDIRFRPVAAVIFKK